MATRSRGVLSQNRILHDRCGRWRHRSPFRCVTRSTPRSHRLFRDPSSEIFYPWAVLDVDTAVTQRRLADYWFLVVESLQPWGGPNKGKRIDLAAIGTVPVFALPHPPPIRDALAALALYPWTAPYPTTSLGFDAPICFQRDDSLLTYPRALPPASDLPDLETRVYEYGETEEVCISEVINEAEVVTLRSFCGEVQSLLSCARAAVTTWAVLELALDFYMKAFFTRGVEQFLWYVTVLDSLLGHQNEEGFVKKPCERSLGYLSRYRRSAF